MWLAYYHIQRMPLPIGVYVDNTTTGQTMQYTRMVCCVVDSPDLYDVNDVYCRLHNRLQGLDFLGQQKVLAFNDYSTGIGFF